MSGGKEEWQRLAFAGTQKQLLSGRGLSFRT